MRRYLFLALWSSLIICGVVASRAAGLVTQSPKGAQLFTKLGTKKTTAPSLPPLPPGFQVTTDTNLYMQSIKRTNANNIFLSWTGPAGTVFQLQTKTNINQSTWTKIGAETTNRSAVVPNNTRFSIFKVQGASQTSGGTSGQLQFVTMTSAGNAGESRSSGLTVDHVGNIIQTGYILGSVSFGTITIASSSRNDPDGYVAKYDRQGNPLWVKRLGGTTWSDSGIGVTVDSQDNIIVTGYFVGSVDFGGITLTNSGYPGNVNSDIFIAKYSSSTPPVLVWAKRFGGSDIDRGNAVAVDSGNNVFLAAQFNSVNVDFGGTILTNAGWGDIAIAKLAAGSGATLWAKRWGGPDTEGPSGVAIDKSGDILVVGGFAGTTYLGGAPLSSYPGASKVFLAKYSGADGSHKWSRAMGNTNSISAGGVAIDTNTTNVVIVGSCQGAVDYGGGLIFNNGTSAGYAVFVATYNPTGGYVWAKELGDGYSTTIATTGQALAIDSDGTVALTGKTGSSLYVDGQGVVAPPGPGYFIVTMNSAGAFKAGKIAGGGGSQGNGIAFDSFGHIDTCGSAGGGVNFGTSPNGDIYSTAPYGFSGAFIAQYLK